MKDHLHDRIASIVAQHEDPKDAADAIIEALDLRDTGAANAARITSKGETGYYDGRVSVTGRYERPSE